MDRFPNTPAEEEYKDIESIDDDEESEESEEKKSSEKKKSFLETWLKRGEKTKDTLLLDVDTENKDKEEEPSAWKKIGAFLGSFGGDTAKESPEATEDSLQQTEWSESEELDIENPGEEPVMEYEATPEASTEEPQVVFDRSGGELSTPRTEESDEAERGPEVATEPPEVEPGPLEVEEAPDTESPAGETELAELAPEPEAPIEVPAAALASERDRGYAESPTPTERPVEIHEHNEYIEKRGGGLSLPDVLIYRNAANKIKAQGKKIEELRREVKNHEAVANARQELAEKVRADVVELKAAKETYETKVEAPKPPTTNTVDKILRQFESSPQEKGAIKVEAKVPEPPKKGFERSESRELFEERLAKAEAKEREYRAVAAEAEPLADNREEPKELKYEQSHEAKQFTATALADAINESQAKQLIEKAQQLRSVRGSDAPESVLEDIISDSSMSPSSIKSNKQAAIAGITAAVILMVIIFIMLALS